MNASARIITANSRKTEAFPDDALTRESSIAVDKDREHFLVLRQIVANHLLRPHLAEHDRIDGFKMRGVGNQGHMDVDARSEEHTSELQSLMRISYAVFCLQKQ